jgi:hypothetical protein
MRDFDKKLDNLSAVVATMEPSLAQSSLPTVTIIPSQLTEPSQQTPTPTPTAAQPVSMPTPSRSSVLPHPSDNSLPFWESMNDTLSSLGYLDPIIRSISLAHMQMLLDTYRSMVDFFPFVSLPKDCRCQDLIKHRPMLMFAVLTVSSYESVLLQISLSREFRKIVMVRIVKGEKSLDLLQGLLVFIAWHHHYMDPQAVSIPMLLQLCLGIANDLSLDSISRTAKSPLQREDPRDRDAKRAYLGCYYLSCNVSWMQSGKVRSMAYTSTLRSYASELASAWETQSDAVLPILMDVCQYLEDVEETFCGRSEQALVVRTQVKRLSEKWESIHLASKLQANDFSEL